jgi:hypothetical protein
MDTPFAYEAWKATTGALIPGYPGLHSDFIHGASSDPNHLIPQFVHLFPALSANAWAAGGLEAAVRVNAVVAVLGLANTFLLCRRLIGWKGALGAVLALGLNPAFIWGARITLTEVLALFLNVLGLLLLLVAREKESKGWGTLAGGVLGLGVLNRLDAGISVLAIVGFAVAAMTTDPMSRPAARRAAGTFLAVSTLGYIDGRVSSAQYFGDLFERHALGAIISLTSTASVIAWGLAAAPPRWFERAKLGERLVRTTGVVLVAGLLAWLAYALFIRPHGATTGSELAATELGWYLTPFVWPMLAIGFALGLRTRSLGQWLPLLVVAGAALFLYTARTDVHHVHPWASRRWLPQVIPLSIVLGSAAVTWLIERRARARALTAALGSLSCLGYTVFALAFVRPFLFRSMLSGLPSAYERLASYAKSSSVKTPLATASRHQASILTYLYDTPAMMTVATETEPVARGELAGWTAVGFGPFELGDLTEYSEAFVGRYMEGTTDRPPKNLVDFPLLFSIGRVGEALGEVEVPAAHPSLGTLVGRRDRTGAVHTTGRAGTLQNGPWISLTPGCYQVDWIGRVWQTSQGRPSGMLDVILDGGQKSLASAPLRVAPGGGSEVWIGGVDFTLQRAQPGVEFRLQVESDVTLALTRVRLRRLAAPTDGSSPSR